MEPPTPQSRTVSERTSDTVGGRTTQPPSLRHPWMLLTLAAMVLGAVLVVATDIPGFTVLGAMLLGLGILRVGWFVLQQLATPPPPPPDPGTLRKVRLVYRCEMCGAEVRMTSAASEDPEPPRHCMEEMELISTGDDAI